MRALVSRLLFDWAVWRLKRRLLAQSPAIRDLDARERAARKAHKAVRGIHAERSRLMHAELAREVGRG